MEHSEKVRIVSEQLKRLYVLGKKVKVYHGGTNSTRAQDLKCDEVVDTSHFDEVLSINLEDNFALVEPNVSMEKLVRATLKVGLIPSVVMEFPAITVGGAIQGTAEESSSFKYGLFHNICLEYEIVLGNGDVQNCSNELSPDLFYGTAGSYGSLGIITLIKLKLIPSKKFIKLSYFPTYSFEENIQSTKRFTESDAEFVDSIIFSSNSGVVMVGYLSDDAKEDVRTFRKAKDEWFYLHAKRIAEKEERHTEYIPIKDYFFRYDRGGFWMGRLAFKFLKVPFNRVTRCFFDVFMSTRTLYHSLHSANLSQKFIIQDLSLPFEQTLDFLKFSDVALGIYPLWICPLKPDSNVTLSPNFIKTDLVMNVGLWGELKGEDVVRVNRDIEDTVNKLGGRKMLYAHTYYPEDKFWKIYDHQRYLELRKKYHADNTIFDIYTKVKVKGYYKGSIFRGAINFLRSPFQIPLAK
ncbi:MAG: FAD-binding oxidoreductase [Patescibacteria group bacterium]